MTKKIISLVSILATLFTGFSFPQKSYAAADIIIASARITSPTTVVVSFNNPGHALTAANVSKWHIDVNGGGSDPLNPVTATVTSSTNPWEVTLTFKDGALDSAFNPGTAANNIVYSFAPQNDGDVYIGGDFTSYNGTARNRIARLDANGSLDMGFFSDVNSTVESIATQSDGKIIVGGWFNSYNGTSRNRIARVGTNGSLDGTFDPGTGADSFITSIAIQDDGKIIIGGNFTTYNNTSRSKIARINADGSLDGTFDPGTGADSFITSIAIQDDGKIIIGGSFTTYNGTARNFIARLNTNGSLDTDFNPGTGFDNLINSIAIQDDGKIIIGGWFSSYNGTARNKIARLNTNGSLDTEFDPGVGVNANIRPVAIQDDGKILVGGNFTTYNDIPRNGIARLNTDGSLDTTFDPGSGANSTVYSLALQSDGKILAGGTFTSYNGTSINRIVRIDSGNPTPFSDPSSSYSASLGLYADALAVTDAGGDTNTVVAHSSSIEITDDQVAPIIAIAGARITSPNTVVVSFNDPGQTLSSTDVSKWHIDANGGGSDPLNPVTATVTSASNPWEVTLTFDNPAPFSDTASAYSAATGLYADASAVTGSIGDTNVVLAHSASTAITDAQAPTVVTVSPADSATRVTRTDDIVITFSEPMNTSTWDGSFSIASVPTSSAIAYTPTWSEGNTVSTLSHPQQAFYGSRLYTATITTDLEDANGNAIGEYDWSFTTKSSSGSTTAAVFTTYNNIPKPEVTKEVTNEEVIKKEEEIIEEVVVPETSVIDLGCGDRTTGFSSSTGKPCANNTPTTTPTVPTTPTSPNTPTTNTPTTPTTAPVIRPVLVKQGSVGETCSAWQTFLNTNINANLIVDGICGPLTIAAAKKWQASVGLVADGLLGPASRAKAMMQ